MKIYSWNMWFGNARQDEVFAFIRTSDFDLFCLQEVPEEFLARLKTLPFHLAYTVDTERVHPKNERIYLVTVSRYPICHTGEIPLPDYWKELPWRARLFVFLMRPLGWTRIKNRNCFFVDIDTGTSRVRIFNLHLILANPKWRLQEFERAMVQRDPSLPSIVCGDFNILESPRVTILNWILAGRIQDALLWRRERTHIESRFLSHSLTNSLRSKSTHPLSNSQLDHILVSKHFSIQDAAVIQDRHGSDHHPIFTSVTH